MAPDGRLRVQAAMKCAQDILGVSVEGETQPEILAVQPEEFTLEISASIGPGSWLISQKIILQWVSVLIAFCLCDKTLGDQKWLT